MSLTLIRSVQPYAAAPRYYLSALWKRLNTDPVFIWAQAISFKVLITILPLILIATGVFGLVLRQDNPFETVADALRSFLPPGQSTPLIDLLFRLQEASPTLTILGVSVLLVTVVTLFSVLRYVIGTAMGSGRHRYRSILHGYVFDMRMAVQVGLLFLLSFLATLAVSAANTIGAEVLVEWGMDPEILRYGQRAALRVASLAVPFLLSLLMFAQLFYFIPRPRPPGSSAIFGATFTALLFELAKNAFALYATWFGRFRTGDEALSSVFWLLIVFVLWVYFSGLVLIVGAMMVSLHEQRNRPERGRLRGFVRKYLFRKRRLARGGEGAPGLSGDGADPEADTSREVRGQEPEGETVDTQAAPPAAGPPPARPAS
jgi:membrane protein